MMIMMMKKKKKRLAPIKAIWGLSKSLRFGTNIPGPRRVEILWFRSSREQSLLQYQSQRGKLRSAA